MRENTMAKYSPKQYAMLRRCSNNKDMRQWNEWRREHPENAIYLAGADFERAVLAGADLMGADLRGANLQGANLIGAILKGANLNGALFFEANLKDADLQGAHLWGADLNGVILEGANFCKAKLSMANLRGARLEGIRFDSKSALAVLVHPLSEKQIASAVFADEQQGKNRAAAVGSCPEQCVPVSERFQSATVITRAINFDQENIQAGIGILNYFGEILRQKYEGKKARVIIEQEGLNVRMAVETDDGEKETIEKALEDYVTVVTGRRQMTGYLPKPMAELALKQKIELVNLELKHANVLRSIERVREKERAAYSEDSLDRLYKLLSVNICINGK